MTVKSTTTSVRFAHCSCGCGNVVRKAGSLYVPGHDARHAGLVAREVIGGAPLDLLKALPSNALRAKAANMVNAVTAKAEAKAASPKSGKPVIETAGEVKVGRWTYPARLVDGLMERNTKRDGSGEWVAV